MNNKGRVYFGLRGDFAPDDLTEAIGTQPTKTQIAGERIPGKAPKSSLWAYSTEEIETELLDVYDLSSKIVNDLGPFADRIAEVVQKHDLEACLQVVLWISTDDNISTPAIGFESEVINFLNRVGGTIDIDTYINSEEDSEQSH